MPLHGSVARKTHWYVIDIGEELLGYGVRIVPSIDAVCATRWADMGTMHVWSEWDHGLVDHSTHQCIHAHLVRLAEADFVGEEICAVLCRVVLHLS